MSSGKRNRWMVLHNITLWIAKLARTNQNRSSVNCWMFALWSGHEELSFSEVTHSIWTSNDSALDDSSEFNVKLISISVKNKNTLIISTRLPLNADRMLNPNSYLAWKWKKKKKKKKKVNSYVFMDQFSRLRFYRESYDYDISENRAVSIIYLSTKFELDRFSNNGDLLSGKHAET